jgi:hypothetical protein
MASAAVVINSFVVDRRLQTIYNAVSENNISKAAAVTNDTLRLMNGASHSEIDRQTHGFIVSNLYTTLVDLAMGRLDSAHCKIRDCHYQMVKVDLENQDPLALEDYSPPCPSPAELEDREFEELLNICLYGMV